jgi:hypothetical protein
MLPPLTRVARRALAGTSNCIFPSHTGKGDNSAQLAACNEPSGRVGMPPSVTYPVGLPVSALPRSNHEMQSAP